MIDGMAVSNIKEIETRIKQHHEKNMDKPIEMGFATITKNAMHPQEGIPQLYHDQLNILGNHLWQLCYDPEWNTAVEEDFTTT